MSGQEDRKKLEESLNLLKQNQEHYETLITEQAKLYRRRFLALVQTGFTEQQALDIIKARGLE